MNNLEFLRNRLHVIEQELEELKTFRLTSAMKKFQRTLFGEQSFVKNEIQRLSEVKTKVDHSELLKLANKNRSEKMKRTWRYLKAIKENYPVDLSLKDLRTALRKHRQGLETDVPDVAWRNPSP